MVKTKLVFTLFFLISYYAVFSQEQQKVVYKNNDITKDLKSLSFYVGPVMQFTYLDNDFAFFVGGKGGWAFKKKVLFGLEGYLLKSSNKRLDDSGKELSFNYGGFFVGYVLNLSSKVHLIPTVLSACGSMGERKVEADGDYVFFRVTDDFMVLQPALDIDFVVVKNFKVGLGVNYRITSGIDAKKYLNQDFSGLAASVAFKFEKS